MKVTNHTVHLLRKYISDTLNVKERMELQAWADQHPAYRQLLTEITDVESLARLLAKFDATYGIDEAASIGRMQQRIVKGIASKAKPDRKINRVIRWIPYAAALLIVVSIGTRVYFSDSTKGPDIVHAVDIEPGGNRATLTLADGRIINLNAEQSGIIVGDEIQYLDGTAVLGGLVNDKSINALQLTTPKGGQYQITLADGTKVWLNSASILRYPSRFTGSERVVELEGEAYFDVSEQVNEGEMGAVLSVPFRVVSKGQQVEVLGTQFNVSAYDDDKEIRTTLVEGKVQVVAKAQNPVTLFPGEQSILTNNTVTKRKVNIAAYTSWKDGVFYFDETSLYRAMSQLSRWYDVAIVYEDHNVPESHFYGEISKQKPLSEVLEILQEGGVRFEVAKDGKLNKLIVLAQ